MAVTKKKKKKTTIRKKKKKKAAAGKKKKTKKKTVTPKKKKKTKTKAKAKTKARKARATPRSSCESPPCADPREEAIRKYKEKHKAILVPPTYKEDPEEAEEEKMNDPPGDVMDNIDPTASLENTTKDGEYSQATTGPKLSEEYNIDDEQDYEDDEDYKFGWGHNDAFDKPEEVSEEPSYADEDEQYVKGIDHKDNNDEE